MLQKIKRFRLWLALCLLSLLFFTYCPFLKHAYAINGNVIPLFSNSVQNIKSLQNLQESRSSDEKNRGFSVGVNVDLVMMYTSVFDKDGRFVGGLHKEDFNLYEDGIKQVITSFSQEDVPISMGIVIDTSSSMESKLEQVNRAAHAFINASNSQDETFLIGFNDEVELLQPFTSDIDEITDALENAVITGGTALYDAIFLGVEEAERGEKSKKAIVIITDGEDLDSTYSLRELIANIQESDVQIFCVGFLDMIPKRGLFSRWTKSPAEKARDALQRISEETGGKAYFPEDISEIHRIVSEIAHELRNQYSIGYFSNNHARDGSWRRVVIKLDNSIVSDPQLRYRRGYYAPRD